MTLGVALWAWLLRMRFRARSGLREQLATARLAVGRWLPVVVGIVLAAVSLYIDARLIPAYLPVLGISLPQQTSGLATPLFEAVAGLSGLLALAVAVSSGPLESALGRFPAVVGAPLLEDKARDGLLALLLTTLTLALCLLIVSSTALATPITGSFFVALLAVATLATLVGYVRWRGTLRRPKNLAWHMAGQMNGWLLQATRRARRDGEARTMRELSELYSENFARMVQLCRSLLRDDEEEAGEVLAALSHTVMVYIPKKRRFDPESEWFPIREQAREGQAPPLLPLYDDLMLGAGTQRVHDHLWFERTVARAWEDLLTHARKSEASSFYRVWVIFLKLMLDSAFTEQEFGLFERLLGTVNEGARHLEEVRELEDLVSLPGQTIHKIEFDGLQTEQAEQTLASGAPLNIEFLLTTNLPTELVEMLLEVGKLVQNQEAIEGYSSYRTPPAALGRELEHLAQPRQEELCEKYMPLVIAISSKVAEAAAAGGHEKTLASLFAHDLAAIDGLVLRAKSSVARQYLESSLEAFAEALASEGLSAEYKRRLIEGLRAPWLHALHRSEDEVVDIAGRALAQALAERSGSDEAARSDLIAILAIGDIACEVRGDAAARAALLDGIEAARLEVGNFAEEALQAAEKSVFGRVLPMEDFVRYSGWAQPILRRVCNLDEVAKSTLRSLLPSDKGNSGGTEEE